MAKRSARRAGRARAIGRFAVPLALGSALSAAAPPPLPARIDPATLGPVTFSDSFRTLDWGVDQVKPDRPHRWRTVLGYGGPTSAGNRALSRTTLAVDPDFAGAGGKVPLRLNPFAAGPGGLTITARRASPDLKAALYGRTWTSGLLTTKFSFAQRHGYFEAEMVLPACQKGAWPAFWLLPRTNSWPKHGEIDAPETIGDGKIYWSTHSGVAGKKGDSQATTPADCSGGWHRYGVLWRPDRIGFYYDRRLVAQAPTPGDYDQPMFLLLNLAVGGAWPGEPPATTKSISMKVRNVSVWQLDGG